MFSQVKGQEEQRRPEAFVDRHGREYFANVELKTGDPCEVLQPRFKAPLEPEWFRKMLIPPVDDHDIVKMVPRLQRAKKGYQIEIDYDAWIMKLQRALDRYQTKLYEGAKTMAKGKDAHDIATNPPPVLLAELGAPPLPPITFVEAMKAGNKWALGLDEKIPVKAKVLLDEIETWVTRKRRRVPLGNAIADPLADDETESVVDEVAFEEVTDPFGDVEEAADKEAVGTQTGRPVPLKPKRKPRQKVDLTPAAV